MVTNPFLDISSLVLVDFQDRATDPDRAIRVLRAHRSGRGGRISHNAYSIHNH